MLRNYPQCVIQPSEHRSSHIIRWRRNAPKPQHRNNRCNAHVVTGVAYEDIIDILAHRAIQRSLGNSNFRTTSPSTDSSLSSNRDSKTASSGNATAGVLQAAAAGSSVRRVLIGIAGGPGSGKSTLATEVAARINQLIMQPSVVQPPASTALTAPAPAADFIAAEPPPPARAGLVADGDAGAGAGARSANYAVVLPMDGFHYYRRELDTMPDPKEAHARRGAPWTFDAAKFVEAVRKVRAEGCSTSGIRVRPVVWVPSFDHGVGDPVEDDVTIAPESAVVLVEGNYMLLSETPWCELRALLDEAWFVDCPLEVAMHRVYERQTSIGLAPEVSRTRIATNDRPNAELVAASAAAADLIVPSTVPFRRGPPEAHVVV